MSSPDLRDPTADPIVVIADADRVLERLRLAVLRSDTVIAVTSAPEDATRRFLDVFAITSRAGAGGPDDLAGAGVALVVFSDEATENEIVRAARKQGVPIYEAGRALVSDFTPLALVEQRPLTSLAA